MASTSAMTSVRSEERCKWAIVRHYQVLYSSDGEHKQEGNRVWHDGKLVQHTFDGKLFLYDDAGVELASAFEHGKATELLADGTEVKLGASPYTIEVQTFERVSRTDIAPLLEARERARLQRRAATTAAAAQHTTAATSGMASSRIAPQGSGPAGPKSSHTFRTPFKRKARSEEESVGSASSSSRQQPAPKRLGSMRTRGP